MKLTKRQQEMFDRIPPFGEIRINDSGPYRVAYALACLGLVTVRPSTATTVRASAGKTGTETTHTAHGVVRLTDKGRALKARRAA